MIVLFAGLLPLRTSCYSNNLPPAFYAAAAVPSRSDAAAHAPCARQGLDCHVESPCITWVGGDQ